MIVPMLPLKIRQKVDHDRKSSSPGLGEFPGKPLHSRHIEKENGPNCETTLKASTMKISILLVDMTRKKWLLSKTR